MDELLFKYLYEGCQLPYRNALYCVMLVQDKLENVTDVEDAFEEVVVQLETKPEPVLRFHLGDNVVDAIDLTSDDIGSEIFNVLTNVDIPQEKQGSEPILVQAHELARLVVTFFTGLLIGVILH